MTVGIRPFEVLKGFYLFGSEEIVYSAEVFFDSSAAKFVHFFDESVEEIPVVGDADDCAVKVLQGGFEDIFGLHVQVVRRLIEDEEVARLEEEPDHRESASFASGEDFDFFLGGFAAEHEGAEDIADLRTDVSDCNVINSVEDGEVLIEKGCLVLGKITDLDVVSYFEGAQVVELAHDTLDESGFTFSVLADECHFLASSDGESDVMEDIVVSEIFSQVFDDERKIATSRCRRKTEVEAARVLQIHLETFEFLQLLDAALYLDGFGGFISEALDEILGVLNHLLLVLVGADLLLMTFLAELHKTAVVDVIIVDAPERYFYRPGAGVILSLIHI